MAKPKAETNAPVVPAAAPVVDADTKEETPVQNVQSNTEKRMAEIVVPEYATMPHLTTADIRFMPAKVAGVTAPAKRASVTDGEAKLNMVVLDSGRTLEQLENVVRVGLQSFIEAGEALLEIRARGLWKTRGAKSFGEYAVATFNLSRPRIYQLVDVAQVAAILVNNGRTLPSIGSRLNEFAPLKNDPAKVLEVADKVAATTPTGDLGEAAKGAIKEEVDKAQGKEPKAPATTAPANGTNGGNLNGLNGNSAPTAPTDDEIAKAAEANGAQAPAPTPTVSRASPAALKADEKLAPQSLTTVLQAMEGGAYVDNSSGATKNAIQRLAAMCLSYLAQDWSGAPPKVAPAYTIGIAQAKEIVRGLKKAQKVDGQAKAKAALSGEQAAQVEANVAAVAASAPAPVEVVEAPTEAVEAVVLVANPTTAAEAYAILDASREWVEAGSKGKRPVTGTQINRADALLQKLTEEAAEEGAEDESDEADDIAEAEAEEIDLGIVA